MNTYRRLSYRCRRWRNGPTRPARADAFIDSYSATFPLKLQPLALGVMLALR